MYVTGTRGVQTRRFRVGFAMLLDDGHLFSPAPPRAPPSPRRLSLFALATARSAPPTPPAPPAPAPAAPARRAAPPRPFLHSDGMPRAVDWRCSPRCGLQLTRAGLECLRPRAAPHRPRTAPRAAPPPPARRCAPAGRPASSRAVSSRRASEARTARGVAARGSVVRRVEEEGWGEGEGEGGEGRGGGGGVALRGSAGARQLRRLHSRAANERERMVHSLLAMQLDDGDDLPPGLMRAAAQFEKRQLKLSQQADAALIAVHRDVTSHRKTNFLATTTNEIARNRLFVSERYDPFAQEYTSPRPEERKALIQYSRQRHRTKSSWSIADSCWAPRARDGNSKDFLETDEALSRMFRVDWEFALRGHGLERLIIENDDESGMWRDADGNNVHDEIDEVADVLDRYRRVIYGAFEYYCCIFAEDELQSLGHVRREADVFNMPRAAYDGFVEECKLVGKGLSLQEHAALFAQINAVEFEMAVRDRHNPRGCLCRHEFIQALVRIAIAKYVLSGKITDASDAVESLLTADIASNLPERALQNSNTFRTRYCYTEKTDEVLSKHMALLRRLYKHYSQAYQAEHSRLSSAELMSVGEWMALLDHLGLFATDQLTAEQGRLIFMWSRIRSIEDYLDESEISLRHMSFEDFMEAVVRVATLIALPSDDEVKEARVRDGGEFLINLQDSAPNEFRNFVTSRRHEWDQPPTQSVGRCVDHFLCYIIWVIECSVGSRVPVGEKRTQLIFDGVIDSAEVAKFIQDGGRSAHGRAAEEAANPTAVADRAVLLQALRRFHVTSSLGDTKLQRVADKMTVRRWEQGDCVFRQGEEADAFYVLIEGEAEVMRQDGERGEEKVIKTLKEGHPFGERALWTDEPRYAGVRVRTWPCKTMAISSADFERAIGPLKRYVKNLDSMGDTLAPVRVVIEPAELSEGRAFRGHPQRASCRDRAF